MPRARKPARATSEPARPSGGDARRSASPAGSGTAAPLVPPAPTLESLRDAAAGCKACDLWTRGTQTVFGEGPPAAEIVLIGEQPGDREDEQGRPFVGPAGHLLDAALADAGIDRRRAYVTNTVKHFKWEARGKRRIHQKPNAAEIRACRPWLDAELAVLRPRAVVCLGATAAQALLGRGFKVTEHGGDILRGTPLAPLVMATIHPSAVLRATDDAARRAQRERLVADLRGLARALEEE